MYCFGIQQWIMQQFLIIVFITRQKNNAAKSKTYYTFHQILVESMQSTSYVPVINMQVQIHFELSGSMSGHIRWLSLTEGIEACMMRKIK